MFPATTTGQIRLHSIRLDHTVPLGLLKRDMAELVGGCLGTEPPLKNEFIFYPCVLRNEISINAAWMKVSQSMGISLVLDEV